MFGTEGKTKEAVAETRYVPKKEFWTYGIAALGQGMVYAAMSSYISDFYLNVMGLAPLFVMFLMLLARVWDAVNDPLMGMIVDKGNSRFGKYKPYIIFTAAPIALLTFLMFYVPDFAKPDSPNYNSLGTCFWVSVVYVMWGMVYTAGDVPYWSLPNAMTPDAAERGSIISCARTLNGIGSAFPMAIVMGLGYAEVSYETRYQIMAAVAAVSGCALFAASYITTKERIKIPKAVRDVNYVSPLKWIFSNKEIVLVIIMGVLSSGRYMLQGASIHVSRYTFYLEGMSVAASQSTVQLVYSVCTAAGMFGVMLLCPLLIKKFSYKRLIISTCLIGSAAGIAEYFIGVATNYNLWALIPFIFVSSIPLGVMNVVSYAMIGDCLDLMELNSGRRETGLGSACQSFVNKLGNALATTMIIAMYMIVGLKVSNMAAIGETGVSFVNPTTLSNNIRNGMFMLVSLIPAVSMLLCCIPIFFYDLQGEKKEKMLADLAAARKERGIDTGEKIS
jgi:sugar (glycoside-pentoside-hexuronide) transporter